jgi:hypothetical protein
MARSTLIPAALLVALAALAPAAPRPKEPGKPPAYFATRVGDRLVYDDRGRVRTWEVTTAEEKGGETLVTVSEGSGDKQYQVEKVSVSVKGVCQLEVFRFKFEANYYYIKSPARAGDTWDVHTASLQAFQGWTGTLTVGKEEEVETPAGKFRAVPVEAVGTPLDRNSKPTGKAERYTRWFAEGVGVVKMTYPDGQTRVLKSFTPGKK